MSSAFPPSAPVHTDTSSQNLTWNEAFCEFSLHLQATRAKKTQRYYEVQVVGLIRWATRENVQFAGFGKTTPSGLIPIRSTLMLPSYDSACSVPRNRTTPRVQALEQAVTIYGESGGFLTD
jgi:hypothetical protein